MSSVENMGLMFYEATAFDQDINSWVVSKVTNFQDMFLGASAFNQDINSWDVSKVGNFQYMFYGATSFNQNLCRFGRIAPSTSNYDLMFHGASSCTSTTKPSSKINTNIVPNYAYVGPFCASECNLVSSIRVLQSYILSLYYTHNIHVHILYSHTHHIFHFTKRFKNTKIKIPSIHKWF